MSKRILVVLADGFEETEAVAPTDVWRRTGIEVTWAGLRNKEVTGAHRMRVLVDTVLTGVNYLDFDAIMLPGGMPGAMNLYESSEVQTGLIQMAGNQKVLAAICAAPIVLAKAGLLKNKRFTAYGGFEKYFGADKPTGNAVESDGNLVTGNGPGAVFEFAKAVAVRLALGAAAQEQLNGMLVK